MLAVASRPMRGCSAKAASAWRLNHEDVAGTYLRRMRCAEALDAAVAALDPVLPGRAGLAAREAERRDDAMIREQHSGHRLQEAYATLASVAATMTSCATRAATDAKVLQPHREAPFQDFGVGETRVRHVGLHGRGAVEVRSRAGAARDGFVVLVRAVAEREVVH